MSEKKETVEILCDYENFGVRGSIGDGIPMEKRLRESYGKFFMQEILPHLKAGKDVLLVKAKATS